MEETTWKCLRYCGLVLVSFSGLVSDASVDPLRWSGGCLLGGGGLCLSACLIIFYLEINQNDCFFLFFFFLFRHWCLRLEFRNAIFIGSGGFASIISFIPVYYLHQHLVILKDFFNGYNGIAFIANILLSSALNQDPSANLCYLTGIGTFAGELIQSVLWIFSFNTSACSTVRYRCWGLIMGLRAIGQRQVCPEQDLGAMWWANSLGLWVPDRATLNRRMRGVWTSG